MGIGLGSASIQFRRNTENYPKGAGIPVGRSGEASRRVGYNERAPRGLGPAALSVLRSGESAHGGLPGGIVSDPA